MFENISYFMHSSDKHIVNKIKHSWLIDHGQRFQILPITTKIWGKDTLKEYALCKLLFIHPTRIVLMDLHIPLPYP